MSRTVFPLSQASRRCAKQDSHFLSPVLNCYLNRVYCGMHFSRVKKASGVTAWVMLIFICPSHGAMRVQREYNKMKYFERGNEITKPRSSKKMWISLLSFGL